MKTIRHDDSGVIRTRTFVPMSRRTMLQGMAATGGLAALGVSGRRAKAGTAVKFMGWQGYDEFLGGGDYLAANDITLDKTYISAPEEIVARLRLSAGQVDVCTPYFIHCDFMASEGLLEPLDLEQIPNFKNLIPTIVKFSEGNMSEGGKWYSAPFTWASINLMYNPVHVKEVPTSWRDMLKDEYKGKCAIPADLPSAFSTWGRVATGTDEPNHMTYEELEKTVAFIVKMKKEHLRTIASSYGELVDLLAREEVIICQGAEPVAAWIGDGPEIRWVYPEEGCMSFIEGYSIGRGAPNLEAAHALINQALSVEGQLAGAAYNGMPVTNAEALAGVDDWNRSAYPYDDIESYFTTKLRVDPMYYLEEDGVHATWDDYIEAWEHILKA
ncbi:MAG: substrate-binding domain-containing protein [Proteobacteria bacterium]|nr:substrate-binding domain-containing protein [Pseudomonadota bacterium]